jgi:hypothetical protein
MRDTDYATELATVDDGGCRIERLLVKSSNTEEIRFSWWKDGRMMMRPLDLPEDQLLRLFQAAIKGGVFTPDFLLSLHSALYDCR